MNQREFLYLCARGFAIDIEDAIDEGASINRRAMYQGASVSPLFVAVMENNLDAILVLLDHKAKNFPGFMAAMINEDEKMLNSLVNEFGADINCKDNHKRTPLLCAVTANKSNIVKWLLELGADVNMRVGYGFSVLTYAALMFDEENGLVPDAEIIDMLMKAGADYDEAMLMAVRVNNLKLVKILVESGADLNKNYITKQSPLSVSIANIQHLGDEVLPMIEFLVKHGANLDEILNLSHEDGGDEAEPIFTTNLHLAISMNSDKCLEILLKNGANPNIVDSRCRTPLMYAVLESYEMTRVLLENGAKPDIGDLEGRTPLTLAVIDSDVEADVVKILLESGASPNSRDKSGFTPLMWAVNNHDRSPEIFVASLIRTGALRAEKGAEWFGLAVSFEALRREIQLDAIRLLISYGADVTLRDRKGVTALGWAIMNDDEEVAEILRKAAEEQDK